MKILIISDAWHPQTNGVVRTYENLCRELMDMGHDVRIMGPRDFPLRLPMPGYTEIELVPGPYGRMRRLIDDFNPDHLHLGTEGWLGWAARRHCLKTGRPYTTAYHTQFPDYVRKRVARFFPALADRAAAFTLEKMKKFHAPAHTMMVATRSLEDQLRAQGFAEPITPLTRGIDHSVFYPGPKTLFQEMRGPVALYVGRVAVEKSIEDFLRMGWHGGKVVVGDGPQLAELRQTYPDVLFTGKKTGQALADHYRSADVFVFPSRTDTFGLVLIEAMACGLPIAGYPVTGPADIVTEPYLGVVDESLAAAAASAVTLPGAERRAHHARTHYSWRHAAEQFARAI